MNPMNIMYAMNNEQAAKVEVQQYIDAEHPALKKDVLADEILNAVRGDDDEAVLRLAEIIESYVESLRSALFRANMEVAQARSLRQESQAYERALCENRARKELKNKLIGK